MACIIRVFFPIQIIVSVSPNVHQTQFALRNALDGFLGNAFTESLYLLMSLFRHKTYLWKWMKEPESETTVKVDQFLQKSFYDPQNLLRLRWFLNWILWSVRCLSIKNGQSQLRVGNLQTKKRNYFDDFQYFESNCLQMQMVDIWISLKFHHLFLHPAHTIRLLVLWNRSTFDNTIAIRSPQCRKDKIEHLE